MTYRVTAFNQSNPSDATEGEINWQVRCDGTDFRAWEKEGETLTFKITMSPRNSGQAYDLSVNSTQCLWCR